MKKIFLNILLFLVFVLSKNGFAVVLTITYDANQGVSGLVGSSQVYMHSGASDVTGPLNSGSWKYVVGNWGLADGVGEMYSIGNNKWRISIDPIAYYSHAPNGPVQGASIKRIALVFRNELGTQVGKDANNSDIFIDLSGPNPLVFNSDGSPFSGVVAANSPTLFSGTSSIYRYLSVWHIDDSLKFIDTSTFAVLRSVKLNADSPIVGATGFSRHPLTGEYYAVVRFQTLANRCLAKINPANGDVTVIGNLLDRFANITFLPSGKLIGVTGEGALTPESLFSIDINTAATTFIRALGNGSSGEAIGYCSDNGKIYHRSGLGTQVFEAIDTINYNITPITQSGNATNGETYCLHYIGNKKFIATSSEVGGGKAFYVDTNGVFTFKTLLNQPYKGFSAYGCVRNVVGSTSFCVGSSSLLTATPGAISYQWYKNGQAISGATSMTYHATTPGKYNCFFTDLCGADSLATGITIQQNSLPIVVISGPNSFCEGGSMQLSGSGGGSSQWYKNGVIIPGAISSFYTVNAPGLYNMIKTNTNGCADSAAVGKTISRDAKPQLSLVTAQNLNCFQNASGTIDAAIASGTAPYLFSWSNGGLSLSLTSLSAGLHTLYVTDFKTCKDTLEILLTEPPQLQVTVNTLPPLCQTGSDGAANAIVQGGTRPMTYSWSNGSNDSIASNLSVGFYFLTVIDAHSCINNQNFQVLGPPAVGLQVTATDVTCAGLSNGTAAANAFGGTGLLSYSWSNGASTSSVSGLPAGVITVIATDANMCTSAPFFVFISEPSPLQVSVLETPVSCAGLANGTALATVSGGTTPYLYSWSTGDLSNTITQLGPGNYQLHVSDSNACQIIDTISIAEPLPISIDTVVTHANNQLNNGEISITVAGGTAPFTFSWSDGSATQNISNLAPGHYSVKIVDANGCTFNSDTIALYGVGIKQYELARPFRVYPNPSNGYIRFTADRNVTLCVYNALMQQVAELSVEPGRIAALEQKLVNGIYFISEKGNRSEPIKLIVNN